MQYTVTVLLGITLCACALSPAAALPTYNDALVVSSATDITGQQVRAPRSYATNSQQNDYFICYPSSVVYGQNYAQQQHRRSSELESRNRALNYLDSFDARKDRADRERAAYTDSFGK